MTVSAPTQALHQTSEESKRIRREFVKSEVVELFLSRAAQSTSPEAGRWLSLNLENLGQKNVEVDQSKVQFSINNPIEHRLNLTETLVLCTMPSETPYHFGIAQPPPIVWWAMWLRTRENGVLATEVIGDISTNDESSPHLAREALAVVT